MPSARGLRADGLTNGTVFNWKGRPIAGGPSGQDAEALVRVGSAIPAEGHHEGVENDDHPDDGPEDEDATHLEPAAFLPALDTVN
jgi:hypothetical protein